MLSFSFKSIPNICLNLVGYLCIISHPTLNALLASQDLVTIERDQSYIPKTSSNINQLVYYILKMYCDKTMNKTYNFPKEET